MSQYIKRKSFSFTDNFKYKFENVYIILYTIFKCWTLLSKLYAFLTIKEFVNFCDFDEIC